jgi:hypothetical protein
MRIVLFALTVVVAGCVIEAPAPTVVQPAPVGYTEPPPPAPVPEPAAAVSIAYEPAVSQPPAIAVGWAPPPMLVEVPPPAPFPYAAWVGGYWVWQGEWVWAQGHWMAPPRAQYVWVHPYYEHRGDEVIFVDGHWSPPGVVFVPPPPGVRLVLETPAVGVIAGPPPRGPEGCFVPAPPGSRAGIIIPAPIGTAPAVVTSAPPVVAVGMRITNNVTNVTNNTNVTNITRVTNVTIIAPATSTASGHAVNTSVPAAPHLAAARPAVVQARAPEPVSARPVPTYVPGSRPPVLPHAPVAAAAANRGHERPEEFVARQTQPPHATPAPAMNAQHPNQPPHPAAPTHAHETPAAAAAAPHAPAQHAGSASAPGHADGKAAPHGGNANNGGNGGSAKPAKPNRQKDHEPEKHSAENGH